MTNNYNANTIPDVAFVTGQTSTAGIQAANNGFNKIWNKCCSWRCINW